MDLLTRVKRVKVEERNINSSLIGNIERLTEVGTDYFIRINTSIVAKKNSDKAFLITSLRIYEVSEVEKAQKENLSTCNNNIFSMEDNDMENVNKCFSFYTSKEDSFLR